MAENKQEGWISASGGEGVIEGPVGRRPIRSRGDRRSAHRGWAWRGLFLTASIICGFFASISIAETGGEEIPPVPEAPAEAESGEAPTYDRFDHFATGFPLVGGHAGTPCESCHTGGRFEALPLDCASCHGGSGAFAKTRKPPAHVPSSVRCGDCHTVVAWSQARFDHTGASPACGSCHNGSFAEPRPPTHLPTSNRCGDCHSTTFSFSVATMNHVGITTGCFTCHNGSRVFGKHPGHIPSPDNCELCHNTTSFAFP